LQKTKDCIIWKGAKNEKGYGVGFVHRIAYAVINGPIPSGLVVCHKCDNPSCFNIKHLFLGTQKENIQDASRKGRLGHGKTHGLIKHPEKVARGNNHFSRKYPHLVLRGTRNGFHRLTERQAKAIKKEYLKTRELKRIAKKYGVSTTIIWGIGTGRRWKHV
jgi:HNH endonuclease